MFRNDSPFSEIIASGKEIAGEIERVARSVVSDYSYYGKDQIVVIGVMNGAFMFMADLVRAINNDFRSRWDIIEATDFIRASSYGNQTESSGTVTITEGPSINIAGKHVLLVDDIVDSGRTLAYLNQELMKQRPASLKTAVFIRKGRRLDKKPIEPDYIGLRVESEGFVIGYGLDYAGHYRDLPMVGILKSELIKK